MAKGAKKYYECTCTIHGTKDAADKSQIPRIKVTMPRHKRAGTAGCPVCARIARKLD